MSFTKYLYIVIFNVNRIEEFSWTDRVKNEEVLHKVCGPGSSVGIATDYEMDGPGSNLGGTRFSARPDRSWGPPSHL